MMKLKYSRTIIISLSIILFAGLSAAAQTDSSEREKGIELYKKGSFIEAVQALQRAVAQNDADGEAWLNLGSALVQTQDIKGGEAALKRAANLLPQDTRPLYALAYVALSSGKLEDAKNNAEKAISLDPKSAQGYYFLNLAQRRRGNYKAAREAADKAISLNPKVPDFYWAKTQTIFVEAISDGDIGNKNKVFREIIAVLESYPDLPSDTPGSRFVKEKIENAKFFLEAAQDISKISPPVASSDPTVTPLKILRKPRPNYTDAARQNQEAGVIKLLVLFSANGTIEYVLPVKALKYGLTEETLNVAYKINFEPQKKNGKPVAAVRLIEYSFSIY